MISAPSSSSSKSSSVIVLLTTEGSVFICPKFIFSVDDSRDTAVTLVIVEDIVFSNFSFFSNGSESFFSGKYSVIFPWC